MYGELPVDDEWVGTVDLTTGRVDRYVPINQAGPLFRRSARLQLGKALFHTHPTSAKIQGPDRPSATDIYAVLRLDYPVHVIVTKDGLYVLRKEEIGATMRRPEFFRRLVEWEHGHAVRSAGQVPRQLHERFGVLGLLCWHYPWRGQNVVEAVESLFSLPKV